MEPSKPTKLDGNDTTILSHHPYILCHFANYAHHKTLHMHIGLFTSTKGMRNYTPTRHSALLTQQPSTCKTTICATAYSSATKVHNIKWHSNIPFRLSTAIQTDHICHAESVASNPQHHFSMHINMHYTPIQHYPPHCFQQPSYAHKYNCSSAMQCQLKYRLFRKPCTSKRHELHLFFGRKKIGISGHMLHALTGEKSV